MSRGTIRRIAIALLVGGALLVAYPAVSGGLLWDLGAACGYICLILFVCLYVFPVRGDGLPHARLLGLSQHKSLGWCVLGAAVAHVAVVLLAEPLSTRYLLPSAPVFMWCGMVALLVLVALIITGLSARAQMRRPPAAAPRRDKLTTSRGANSQVAIEPAASSEAGASCTTGPTDSRDGPPAAQLAGPRAHSNTAVPATSRATLHIVLAAALVLTASAHIGGSSQLLSGAFKPVVVLLLLALPLGWYALRPRPARNGAGARALVRPVSHIAAVAVVALLPVPVAKQLLLEPVARPSPIAVSFPHDSHTSVSCVICHHNFVDHTGTTACIECHRSARADLTHSSESTFHTFCRDCHTQLATNSEKHGPTRSCAACHQGIRSNNL
jgi:hypothetical protein